MAVPVDIRGVEDALAAQRTVSGELSLGDVSVGDEVFSFPSPAVYEVTLTNSGAGIVADGSVRATARAQCVRCLCEFDLPVTGEVEGFYVEPGRSGDLPEEQEYELIAESRVDLEPALLQALIVELPFAPVHVTDCKGLCPHCGVDLNVEGCGCADESTATPLAGLKDLLEEGSQEPEPGGGGRTQ